MKTIDKIDLGNCNESALIARLLVMLRNLPDIQNTKFEEKARKLVDENLFQKGVDQKVIQYHFILFALNNEKSIFNQLVKL